MPHLTLPLAAVGCGLEVYIGVSNARRAALTAAKQQVPALVRARMIVDTGASGTVVDEKVLKSLALTPTGTTQILTPSTKGTPVTCPTYDVLLAVDHAKYPLVLGTVPVVGGDFSGQGIEGLIGRDVLQECLLVYDGVAGTFALAF